MTTGTLICPNPRNRNSISMIKSKFLSVSSMNTLLAISKVNDARRDIILAGGLNHRFPWRHLPPPRPLLMQFNWLPIEKRINFYLSAFRFKSFKYQAPNITLFTSRVQQFCGWPAANFNISLSLINMLKVANYPSIRTFQILPSL